MAQPMDGGSAQLPNNHSQFQQGGVTQSVLLTCAVGGEQITSSNTTDGLKADCLGDQNTGNKPLHESGLNSIPSPLLVSASPSVPLVGTAARPRSRSRSYSESALEDSPSFEGQKRRKKEEKKEEKEEDEWKMAFKDVMSNLEMINKKVQEITNRLNEKMLEKRIEEMHDRLKKLEEIFDEQNEKKERREKIGLINLHAPICLTEHGQR